MPGHYAISLRQKLAIGSPLTHRRFAIGDIHGCCKTLKKMLEEVLRLRPVDTLYLLGDYIDRGPDSLGVLDYLLELQKSGFGIRLLKGNHEEMLLHAVADPAARKMWYVNGGCTTMRELGVNSPEAIPHRYLDLLTDLSYILATEDYVFVHAGLDFHTNDPVRDTSPQFMIWSREGQAESAKLGGRILVTGHNVTPLFAIQDSLVTQHITLDNGCYLKGEFGYGALVALDLDSLELLVQENIE
ncbi:MAG: serine/threonine protein phosphatase [Geobacteraceae bacterium]|nr:serine/threonine protein phosphatase [Geobacteraceae bacterium]NTW78912.1 serine/threonine protein phosphatase [Geobacteraceae bacterium]